MKPLDLEALRGAVLDGEVVPVPDGTTVGSLGADAVLLDEAPWRVLVAAARALLEGRRDWYCSSDVDDLGHPPHSELCGPVIIVRVTE